MLMKQNSKYIYLPARTTCYSALALKLSELSFRLILNTYMYIWIYKFQMPYFSRFECRVWNPSPEYEIRVPSMKSESRVWNPSAEYEIRVPSMKSEYRVWNPSAEYEIRVPSVKSECRVWNPSAECEIRVPSMKYAAEYKIQLGTRTLYSVLGTRRILDPLSLVMTFVILTFWRAFTGVLAELGTNNLLPERLRAIHFIAV